MKTCGDCAEAKPFEDFPLNKRGAQGRGAYCRPCMLVRSRESYRRRQAAKGATVREPEALPSGQMRCLDCKAVKPSEEFPRNKNTTSGRHGYCKPCHNARGKESKERLYGGSQHYHRRYRYGMEDGQFDEMLVEQGDLCAVCREEPAVHVDHDHETGAVRDILCFTCNGGLGLFRDRVDILLAAIQYLDRSRGETWHRTLQAVVFPLPTQQRAAAASLTS